jgi:hypothetical protein
MTTKKPLPFNFVFEYLLPKEPLVKPMFGCHALYLGKKIVIILRKRGTHTGMNGVWFATSREHHGTLRKLIPSMRSIPMLGKHPTNWQMIPEKSSDFESGVITVCRLVVKGDPRIGKIPARKRPAGRSARAGKKD